MADKQHMEGRRTSEKCEAPSVKKIMLRQELERRKGKVMFA